MILKPHIVIPMIIGKGISSRFFLLNQMTRRLAIIFYKFNIDMKLSISVTANILLKAQSHSHSGEGADGADLKNI